LDAYGYNFGKKLYVKYSIAFDNSWGSVNIL